MSLLNSIARKWAARSIVTAGLVIWGLSASAQVVLSPTAAYTGQLNGNFALTGNSLVTCPYAPYPTSGFAANTRCNTARAGTDYTTQNADNENYNIYPITADATSGLANSSSADLTVPAGATVVWAGLYWHARADETSTTRNVIRFKKPGDAAYTALTADTIDTMPRPDNTGGVSPRPYPAYMAYKNVTSLISASSASGTYWAGGLTVQAPPNSDFQGIFGGWSLLVAYALPSEPLRSLRVFNAPVNVGPNSAANHQYADIQLTGLFTPHSGTVDAQVGTIVLDGDPYLKGGDTVSLASGLSPTTVASWTDLVDATHPLGNYGTSVISQWGAPITRNPGYVNNFGVDYALVQAPAGVLANSITTATMRLAGTYDWRGSPVGTTTYNDNVYMQMAALAIPYELHADMAITASVNSPVITSGQDVTFTITITNNGSDPAENVNVNALLPAGYAYITSTPSLGTYNPTTGVWSGLGTMAVGATQTLQIIAIANDNTARDLTSTVSTTTYDPVTPNNTANVVTLSSASIGSGTPHAVPALGTWAMFSLMLGLGITAFGATRRR